MGILQLLASGNWIPFFKPLAWVLGSNDAAIFFSEIANRINYAAQEGRLVEGRWVSATAEDLRLSTNLSTHQQTKARKLLERAELLQSQRMGDDGRLHFSVPKDFQIRFINFLQTGLQKNPNPVFKNFNVYYDTSNDTNPPSLRADPVFKKIENPAARPPATPPPPPGCAAPPSSALPPGEEELRIAHGRVKMWFDVYPTMRAVMLEEARLKEEDIDWEEELRKWLRYHVGEPYFLQHVESKIRQSFGVWLRREREWRDKGRAKGTQNGKSNGKAGGTGNGTNGAAAGRAAQYAGKFTRH